jgi:hypothetical protein
MIRQCGRATWAISQHATLCHWVHEEGPQAVLHHRPKLMASASNLDIKKTQGDSSVQHLQVFACTWPLRRCLQTAGTFPQLLTIEGEALIHILRRCTSFDVIIFCCGRFDSKCPHLTCSNHLHAPCVAGLTQCRLHSCLLAKVSPLSKRTSSDCKNINMNRVYLPSFL